MSNPVIEEIGAALASVFGDPYTAHDVGGKFTCGEAESIALALTLAGRPEEAEAWIAAHAEEDDEGDIHHPDYDPDAEEEFYARMHEAKTD